jgi:pyruvate dehydrogenase E2 component (dihydrolipoamide acetyltransferase)
MADHALAHTIREHAANGVAPKMADYEGVIYAPQVALVGFGSIGERPSAAAGMIGARPIVEASLAAEHRASDAHAGSRFLAVIDRRLQRPEEL